MDQLEEFACALRITPEQYRLLAARCPTEELIVICELLKAKAHRSSFRAAMDARVRAWLYRPGPAKPLTPKQLHAVLPKWPCTVRLPQTHQSVQIT